MVQAKRSIPPSREAAARRSAGRKAPAEVIAVRLEDKLFLSPAEVVALTGIKRNKLFKLLARGEIASFKDEGRRFIPRSAILAYGEAKLAQSRVA